MSNQLITIQSPNDIVLNPAHRQSLMAEAEIMAQGRGLVPEHLLNNVAGCFLIAEQAAGWGMSPLAVAQKTFLIKGKIGYEAQLLNAVVSSSGNIVGAFKYEFYGDWSVLQGNWQKSAEQGLGLRVGAVERGNDEPTWTHIIWLMNITTRNSPEWKTDPQMQMSYLGVKKWARLYAPSAILGAYSNDELSTVEPQEIEINPPSKTEDEPAAYEVPMQQGQQVRQEPEVQESQVVINAKQALNECQDAVRFAQLEGWIKGFPPQDFEALKDFIEQKRAEFTDISTQEIDI